MVLERLRRSNREQHCGCSVKRVQPSMTSRWSRWTLRCHTSSCKRASCSSTLRARTALAGQAPESLDLAQNAACVIFVSDASQALTSSELLYINSLCRLCGQVILALTKVDLYPDWTRIEDLNRDILAARQLDCEIVAVSCELAKHAVRTKDRSLLEESGIPRLRSRLMSHVFETRIQEAAATLVSATDQYLVSLEREHADLSDPESAASHVKELQAERDRLARLKEAAPLWQQRLGDGYERLVQHTDHLSLTRTRALVQEVGDLIDAGDPVAMWPEWQAWLLERVEYEQAAVVQEIRQRAADLDVDLADHFRSMLGHDVESPELEVLSPPTRIAPPNVRFEITSGRRHLLNAMKATSGSITMFSVLSVMAGISLGPLAVAPAGLLARNALRDERKRGLERNRMLAKAQVQPLLRRCPPRHRTGGAYAVPSGSDRPARSLPDGCRRLDEIGHRATRRALEVDAAQ